MRFAIISIRSSASRFPIPEAERMAAEIVQLYTRRGVLRKVNNQAYTLNMPEFATTADGTYAMLTIHGAPLPGAAEAALETATEGLAESAAASEELGEPKGGDVSAEGNRIAELVLPIAPPKNAEPGHIGAPEEPHNDPQAMTTTKPKPMPPWVKRN